MTLPTIKLELDLTGVSPANLRPPEQHNVPTRSVRVFKPNFGPYYAASLKVWSVAGTTKTLLTRGLQYGCADMLPEMTVRTGREVCHDILIHQQYQNLPDTFEITYQALGGFDNIDHAALVKAVDDLNSAGETVDWDDIQDKPTQFPPGPHKHDAKDLYGLEYLVDNINDLVGAIAKGQDTTHFQMIQEVENYRRIMLSRLDALGVMVEAHRSNNNNPHGETKGALGLGSVENRHFVQRTLNGQPVAPYASPRTTFNQIKAAVLGDIMVHIDNLNNPHNVTKDQIGLALVQNYATGVAQDIITGTSTTLYVTPLALAQAIPPLIGGILGHIADTNNPHNVTKAQVGLSLVQNYPLAAATELDGGITEERYMTPADLKYMITAYTTLFTPLQQSHFTNVDDPHDLTKAQVGLNLVEDYEIATESDVRFGLADDQYVTPLVFKTALVNAVAGKLAVNQVDVPGGVSVLDASRTVPARLLPNAPGYRLFAMNFFKAGLLTKDMMLHSYVFARAVTFPQDFAGSLAVVGTVATTKPVTIEVLRGEADRIGTIVFRTTGDVGATASKSGVFLSSGGDIQFKAGEIINFRCSVADVALKDVSVSLNGLFDLASSENPMNGLMPSITVRPADFLLFGSGQDASSAAVGTRTKYAIASTTRTNSAAPTARVYACAFGNSYFGTVAGGKVAGASVNSLEEYVYATDVTSVSAAGNLGTARYSPIAMSNENHGIVTGGIRDDDAFSNVTNKYTYAAKTINAVTSLGLLMARTPGMGNARFGYIRGGSTLVIEWTGSTYFGKYTYAAGTLAVVSTSSTLSRYAASAAGNDTVGVMAGGTYQGDAIVTTQRLNYAADTLGAGTALGDARSYGAGSGNATAGYFAGGARTTGVVVDSATIYTYADDTTATGTVLNTARKDMTALSSSPGWR